MRMDMAEVALRQSGTENVPLPLVLSGVREIDVRGDAKLSFALVETLAGFEALEADWNGLFARAARPEHVFQTFAWNWHWCRHYLPREGRAGPRLAIVTGRINGRLELLLPLVVVRKAGLKHLAWMGEPVSQYGDIVVSDRAASLETLTAAWRFAIENTRADLANLRKVRADAVAAPLIASIGAHVTATEEAPYLDLTKHDTFEVFEATLSSKAKKNRRRMLRRLSEQGSVAFETLTASEDAGHLTRYAIILKRGWLKLKNQISLAMMEERYTDFFADAAADRARPTGCKVALIRSRNETAALHVMVEHKAARHLHIAVYASKFEKSGPGSLLLEHAIQEAFKDGITRFDFLAPAHEYKLEFADGVVAVHDHALAITARGRAYTAGYLGMRSRLKAIAEGMPAPLKRALVGAASLVKRKK